MNRYSLVFLASFSLFISFLSLLNIIYSYYFNLYLNLNSYFPSLIIPLILGITLFFFKNKNSKLSIYNKIITIKPQSLKASKPRVASAGIAKRNQFAIQSMHGIKNVPSYFSDSRGYIEYMHTGGTANFYSFTRPSYNLEQIADQKLIASRTSHIPALYLSSTGFDAPTSNPMLLCFHNERLPK